MTRDEILEEVRRTLAEICEVDRDEVHEETRLVDDLAIDSIDAVDMIVRMQGLVGCKVDAASLKKLRTVRDVVDLVHGLSRRRT